MLIQWIYWIDKAYYTLNWVDKHFERKAKAQSRTESTQIPKPKQIHQKYPKLSCTEYPSIKNFLSVFAHGSSSLRLVF